MTNDFATARICYIFLDESGNLDFGPNGTRYFSLTGITTNDITPMVAELHRLKHEMIFSGIDLQGFHAAEDRQAVRNRVFEIIATGSNLSAHSIFVEKRRVPLIERGETRFFRLLCQPLFASLLGSADLDAVERLMVFYDQIGAHRRQETVLKGIKIGLKELIGASPFDVLMHDSKSHPYLQIVDYVCWALYVRLSRGEERPFETIQHLVRSEQGLLMATKNDPPD